MARFKETITRLERWSHVRERRSVWIVTVDTVVSGTRAAIEIPVSSHASVRPVFIVASLRPVTLSAQLHDICVGNGRSIGEGKRVVVIRVMARQASNIAMCHRHSLMECL